MKSKNLEQRVRDLEAEVSSLRESLVAKQSIPPWWERIAGSFENDPDYKKAMRLGKQYRDSLKPGQRTPPRKP